MFFFFAYCNFFKVKLLLKYKFIRGLKFEEWFKIFFLYLRVVGVLIKGLLRLGMIIVVLKGLLEYFNIVFKSVFFCICKWVFMGLKSVIFIF